MANQIKGKISQIIGPVIDVVFQEVEEVPNIYDALEITKKVKK
jgi:F-type H+-transporting ATPase subunit beta